MQQLTHKHQILNKNNSKTLESDKVSNFSLLSKKIYKEKNDEYKDTFNDSVNIHNFRTEFNSNTAKNKVKAYLYFCLYSISLHHKLIQIMYNK